jgi:hypothetical protein
VKRPHKVARFDRAASSCGEDKPVSGLPCLTENLTVSFLCSFADRDRVSGEGQHRPVTPSGSSLDRPELQHTTCTVDLLPDAWPMTGGTRPRSLLTQGVEAILSTTPSAVTDRHAGFQGRSSYADGDQPARDEIGGTGTRSSRSGTSALVSGIGKG